MAEISVDIEDEDLDRVLDALASNYNKPDSVSKEDFADSIIVKFLEENVSAYEEREAKKKALRKAARKSRVRIKKRRKKK